ncbi:MAG: Flagellar hook-associated protein 2 C-terminus [Firmicutes bacterium]|nr:Flagellar hook-associated protein 2 C-terminus [Bacillota bacterium]
MVNAISSYNRYNSYSSLIRQLYGNNSTPVSAILSGYQNQNSSAISRNAANQAQLSRTLRDVREAYDDLKTSAQTLVASSQNSVFKKDDSKAVVSAVQDFAEKYNDTVETLQDKDNSSILNKRLLKNLTEAASDNKVSLADIGITVNNDKTLTVDKDKLEQAVTTNLSAVKTALGSAGGLASKVAKVATNTLAQPMAAMVNNGNSTERSALNTQYQAQLSEYLGSTYTSFYSQLYGVGGLVDTIV